METMNLFAMLGMEDPIQVEEKKEKPSTKKKTSAEDAKKAEERKKEIEAKEREENTIPAGKFYFKAFGQLIKEITLEEPKYLDDEYKKLLLDVAEEHGYAEFKSKDADPFFAYLNDVKVLNLGFSGGRVKG